MKQRLDFDLCFDIDQIRENLRYASKELNPVVLADLVSSELQKLDEQRRHDIGVWMDIKYKQLCMKRQQEPNRT